MLDILLQLINTNRIFNGVSTMAMQIGSRYMLAEIPSNLERSFNKPFFRRLFIFFVCFLAFRDIKLSILMTLVFILVFNYLLDEKSKVYIGNYLGMEKTVEVPIDPKNRVITVAELENAKQVINIYNQTLEKQKIKL